MSVRIAPMAESHLTALSELESLCFSQPWSLCALREEIGNPAACFLTALREGEVLGYVGSHFACGEFYLDNLAVFPSYRRQGVGRALILALTGFARAHHGAFLTLEVRPSNASAIGLYRGLGFYEAGRRKDFYTHPREDALLLRLDL